MSEKITHLTLRCFRGVPDELSIALEGGKSLVVLGDNGTGKSSIADGVEYFFTGRIEELAREGRGTLHHVGSLDAEKTEVAISTDGNLGGITSPQQPHTGTHSVVAGDNFVLRGRTLAAFIDKRKAEKYNYLLKILGLEAVNSFRQDLYEARHALEGERITAESQRSSSRAALMKSAAATDEESLLAAITVQATKAGVNAPTSLESALTQDWTSAFADRAAAVKKSVEAGRLRTEIRSAAAFPPELHARTWNSTLEGITAEDLPRLGVINAAKTYLAKHEEVLQCPLCGQAVADQELRDQITELLADLAKWSKPLDRARARVSELIQRIDACWFKRNDLSKQLVRFGVTPGPLPTSPSETLQAEVKRNAAIDPEVFQRGKDALMQWDAATITALEVATPAVQPQDQALVNLLGIISAGKQWRQFDRELLKAERALQIADRLHSNYQVAQNRHFEEVLAQITGRVAEIYGKLHPGELITDVVFESIGPKGLEVGLSFYGRPQKPPHAVLSESHLNSLGLAFFIAMGETFNEHVGFLVLDDVLNSFDIEHRGHLASLLAQEMGELQLIVLTHDQIFFERLRRLAPTWQKLELTSWTFEDGPRVKGYDVGGLLEKAKDRFADDDVQGAATRGRRALEEILQEVCEGMAAPLPFRRGFKNDFREAQELIKGANRIKGLNAQLKDLLASLELDVQLALNVETHAGGVWASPKEVSDALDRIARFDSMWTCSDCGSRVWAKGNPDSAQCRCGAMTFPPPRG